MPLWRRQRKKQRDSGNMRPTQGTIISPFQQSPGCNSISNSTQGQTQKNKPCMGMYTEQQAMANIATPYSAAVLPLSVHAVETEESVSQRLYFVCKRIMDVILTALLLPLLVPW